MLFTDASFQTAADGFTAGILTPNNGDAILDGNGIGESYPELAQVAAALAAANIIPIFAVTAGLGVPYGDLAASLGRGTVVTLTADNSNIVSAIKAGLSAATTTHLPDAVAGSGDDTLIGNDGDDILEGRQGDDVLHGGNGVDLAVFSKLRADHEIVANLDRATTVIDAHGVGRDGADTLDEIEFLWFGGARHTIDGVQVAALAPMDDVATGIVEAVPLNPGVAAVAGNVLSNDAATTAPLAMNGIESGVAGVLTPVAGVTVMSGVYGDLTIDADGSYG